MTFAELAASAEKDKFKAAVKAATDAGAEEEHDNDDGAAPEDLEAAPDVHFTPIVKLEAVEVKTLEEEEAELFKIRAKLFRFEKEGAGEWKERGTGEVRILQHLRTAKVRLVMRRDQTHKVCANHSLTKEIALRPNIASDRSWVYNVLADVSEGEARSELFAIRFANSENANLFKEKFEEGQRIHGDLASLKAGKSEEGVVEESESEKSGESSSESSEESSTEEPKQTTEDAELKAVSESLENVKLGEEKTEEEKEKTA